MESATPIEAREMWDRLVLLLIARPVDGWEEEFREITRREISRLSFPVEDGSHDE